MVYTIQQNGLAIKREEVLTQQCDLQQRGKTSKTVCSVEAANTKGHILYDSIYMRFSE